jgi:hypothetical protein
MKKTLFLASLLFMSESLFGNPVPVRPALICEFKFDSAKKWELEMGCGPWQIDSICFGTSSGVARIRMIFVKDTTLLFVITPDSLTSPLSINKAGDCIKLYVYSRFAYPYPFIDSMSFGNYPGSVFDSIPDGYSVRRFSAREPEDTYLFFSLAKDSTIGVPYDSSDCCATMTGFVYDKNYKKVTAGNFSLDNPLAFNADSTYSTRVFSRKWYFSSSLETTVSGYQWVAMDPISIDAFPDSVIKQDIHFTELVGIKKNSKPSNPELYMINYPNPFNPGTNFYVRVPDNLKRKEGQIEIYNSIGQKIFVVPVSDVSSYKWDGIDMSGRAVASGVYYYRLVFGNAVYKTGSMILLK